MGPQMRPKIAQTPALGPPGPPKDATGRPEASRKHFWSLFEPIFHPFRGQFLVVLGLWFWLSWLFWIVVVVVVVLLLVVGVWVVPVAARALASAKQPLATKRLAKKGWSAVLAKP